MNGVQAQEPHYVDRFQIMWSFNGAIIVCGRPGVGPAQDGFHEFPLWAFSLGMSPHSLKHLHEITGMAVERYERANGEIVMPTRSALDVGSNIVGFKPGVAASVTPPRVNDDVYALFLERLGRAPVSDVEGEKLIARADLFSLFAAGYCATHPNASDDAAGKALDRCLARAEAEGTSTVTRYGGRIYLRPNPPGTVA